MDNHSQSDRSPYIFKMSWKCVLVGLALVLPGTLLSVEGRYNEETRGKSLCDQSVLLKRRIAHTAVVCRRGLLCLLGDRYQIRFITLAKLEIYVVFVSPSVVYISMHFYTLSEM